MISKKAYIIMFMVLTLIAVSAVTALAAKDLSWKDIGQNVDMINKDVDKDKIVALINNEGITKGRVEFEKIVLALQGKEPSDSNILNAICYENILIQESKQRNLYPSRDDTLVYMKSLKEIQDEGLKVDPDNESYKEWMDFLEGKGLAESDYWESEETIASYQSGLAIARLRSAMAEELGYTHENLETPQQINEFEKVFEDKINDRVQQIEKIILDKNAFQ